MKKLPFSRIPVNNSWKRCKEEHNHNQKSSYIEKQKSNISLIKIHIFSFLTTKIARKKQLILAISPNITTDSDGLSIFGKNTGRTRDPKNSVPILTKISEILSNWELLRIYISLTCNLSSLKPLVNGQIVTAAQVKTVMNEGALRFGPVTGSP